MAIITVVGASGVAVQVTVDGGTSQRFAEAYQSSVLSTYQGGNLTGLTLTPGGNDVPSSIAGTVQGIVTVGGAYSVTGSMSNIVVGSLDTASSAGTPLNAQVTVNAAGNTATNLSILNGNAGSSTFTFDTASGQYIATAGSSTADGSETSGEWNYVTGYSTANMLELGSGTNYVVSEGQDTISGLSGTDTVSLLGASSIATLGTGAVVVDLGSTNSITVGDQSTVFGGNGSQVSYGSGSGTIVGSLSDTISAAGNLQVVHGTSNDISASGALTFLNGTGTTTISAGQATIFGAAGLNAIISTSSETALVVAGGGAETINGASASQALHVFAGTGNDTIIGGSAANTLVGGTGNATLVGGSGASNLFAITDGVAGGNYTIENFGSAAGNVMALYGYGLQNSSGLQNVLDNATVSGGNTTIALNDGSKITFVGVTDLNPSNFNLS